VTEGWRKMHNEELQSLYSSPDIIKVIKSRRLSWAGHTAWRDEKCVQDFGWKALRKEVTWKTWE
jgi:hypothetical protein